mmetsp:Transcript_53095/g.79346  ORF Transcript_53095/g.79346 Transcript_53095/m.79346 type:complete len:240 (-) Transcript_53095:1218-1937(-)
MVVHLSTGVCSIVGTFAPVVWSAWRSATAVTVLAKPTTLLTCFPLEEPWEVSIILGASWSQAEGHERERRQLERAVHAFESGLLVVATTTRSPVGAHVLHCTAVSELGLLHGALGDRHGFSWHWIDVKRGCWCTVAAAVDGTSDWVATVVGIIDAFESFVAGEVGSTVRPFCSVDKEVNRNLNTDITAPSRFACPGIVDALAFFFMWHRLDAARTIECVAVLALAHRLRHPIPPTTKVT